MAKKIVDTILPTTMVGSYPRPAWYKQQLLGRDIRVAFKEASYEETYHDAVAAAMKAGIKAVTDLGPEKGAVRIGAGNYGGKLGKFIYSLKDMIP